MAVNPKLRKPSSVFTPRGEKVTEMYIPRAGLEEKLRLALEQSKHIVVHGESGCGKSWLYKRVFDQAGVSYCTVNLGRATEQGGGIAGVLKSVTAGLNGEVLAGYTEGKSASVNAALAGGELTHEKQYQVRALDEFRILLLEARKKAGRRQCAVVFENLEHILSNQILLDEFKGLLLLVDDPDFAGYNVRTLLVTTATDLRVYLAKIDHANTITNRLYEIPEVGRLAQTQAQKFVEKGLFEMLGINPSGVGEGAKSKEWAVGWVHWFADRIPQYLHELCLEIAIASEASGRVLTKDVLREATREWLRSSLIGQMTAVTCNLNSNKTKKGRKNQLIYAIGRCAEPEFDYLKIEKIIRSEFPGMCDGVKLSVSKGLSDLAEAKLPLIRKAPHGAAYRIVDPRYRILIRWALQKDDAESLFINPFDRAMAL
jgi:hypothetical protein